MINFFWPLGRVWMGVYFNSLDFDFTFWIGFTCSVCLSWAWSAVTKDRRERGENTWIYQQRGILSKQEHEQGQYCILPSLSKNLQLYNEEGVKGVAWLSLIQNFRPETVWSALSDWILYKKAARTSHLKELAAHIQWPLMGADFRSQQVDFESWNRP